MRSDPFMSQLFASRTRLGLGLGGALMAGALALGGSGCNGTGSTSGAGSAGYAVIASSDATSRATLRLTAVDASGQTVDVQTIGVQSGAVVRLDGAVPAGDLSFRAEIFGDDRFTAKLDEANANLHLDASEEAQLKVHVVVGADGKSHIDLAGELAPVIHDVTVDVKTLADGTAAADIHVDATAGDNGSLRYFWSGLGIGAAIEGSSTITITAQSTKQHGGAPEVLVMVEDAAGATAEARVHFSADPSSACIFCPEGRIGADANASANAKADGGAKVTIGRGDDDADGGASDRPRQACLDANATCVAACDATLKANPLTGAAAHGTCIAQCGLTLASCESK